MATIRHLYRYPIKSFGGETIDSAHLNERGIPGDRSWSLRDSQGTVGAKKFPQLMSAHARLLEPATDERPSPLTEIMLPNEQRLLTSDANASDVLSEFTEKPVSLWPLVNAENLDHYRRATVGQDIAPQVMEAQLRAVFARQDHEPLPDLSLFPPGVFEYETPPGTYFDAFPLLILSVSALNAMAATDPEREFDVRRFRPNILVDTVEEGFVENQWIGKDCQIGNAVLHIEMACPRCIMTTHPIQSLPKDPRIMRSLVQHNEGNLGVYASIVRPGRISRGDTLEPMQDQQDRLQ